MTEIVEEENQQNEDESDVVEELLTFFLRNKDISGQFIDLLKALEDSGAIEDLAEFARAILPSNSSLIREIVGSEEMKGGISKGVNLLPGVLFALSSEVTSDAVKAILYNSEELMTSMVNGSKSPQQFSMLKLLALLKDPEFSRGMSAFVAAISVLGKILMKVHTD